jgi:hypothetical protein
MTDDNKTHDITVYFIAGIAVSAAVTIAIIALLRAFNYL